MRKRFEQQLEIGTLLIEETVIPLKCRNRLIDLLAALKLMFTREDYNERIFKVLEDKISANKKATGRKGMSLWQIFVLSQVRLCLNASYDTIHYISNHDKFVRQIMGVERYAWLEQVQFDYQNIYDNVTLLDDQTVKELNEIIVSFGHEVFKKKSLVPLQLKTDSYVVESNVHFPTDYNLLWDCGRKCLDGFEKYTKKYGKDGWRKLQNWRYEVKGLMREVGKTSASGGKNKEDRLREAAKNYLKKARALVSKIEKELPLMPLRDTADFDVYCMIEHFLNLMKFHIDLVNRRIINGEKIPHEEKMMSVFETYTEMIIKGKSRPNVELGLKLAITTDQNNLIVDFEIMQQKVDSEIVIGLADRLLNRYKEIESWSFDKGYWNKENKALLELEIKHVILPKLGRKTAEEIEHESTPKFRKLKNKHSAIESNINELEHRGLNKCPDKGFANFCRYISLGVCAYNLKKIGAELRKNERIKLSQAKKAA
jgi:IS5 family transposase